MNKRWWLCLMVAGLLVGCGEKSVPEASVAFAAPVSNQVEVHPHSAEETHAHTHLDTARVSEQIDVAIVPSELTVGANRFAVGLFDAAGEMVRDAKVHFHYFDLSSAQTPVLESHAEATRLQTPDGTAIFAQERGFDRAGKWGVEVQAQFADGRTAIKRISFTVLAESPTLKPGDAVPAIDTPTAAGVNGDLAQLTTAPKPNPTFYTQSLTQALDGDKPVVLLFATPAYCQTRFCGPSYELTSELQAEFGGQADFIHVEIYTGLPNPAASGWQIAPAMAAFGISTEPWLYLIDKSGRVAYRVEGLFTPEEVEPHLRALLH